MSGTDFVVPAGGPDQQAVRHAVVLRWPDQDAIVSELEESGVPRLVLVDDGGDPPVSADCCQDWMWASGDEAEMRVRLHQLMLRALEHGHFTPELDALGMLRVGLRSVHLPAKERALASLLLEQFGRPVPRDDLVAAAWPEGIASHNVLATRMSSLRARVLWLGIEIHGSSTTGYCMRTSQPPRSAGKGCFEEELTSVEWIG